MAPLYKDMSFNPPTSAFRRLNINTFFNLSLLFVEIGGMWQTNLAPVPMTEPLPVLAFIIYILLSENYWESAQVGILRLVFLFTLLGSLSVLAALRLAMIFKYYRQRRKAGVSFDLPTIAKPAEQPPGALEILLGRSIWRAHFR